MYVDELSSLCVTWSKTHDDAKADIVINVWS